MTSLALILVAVACIGALLCLWLLSRLRRLRADLKALRAELDTLERMRDAPTISDPDLARDWLSERGKR